MNDEEKERLDNILKLIFEKSSEKKSLGNKQLEIFMKNYYNITNSKERFTKTMNFIKKEIFDNSSFRQNIIHGDMSIFISLFSILKSNEIKDDKIYYNIIEPLLNFATDSDIKLVTNAITTLIKIIKGNGEFILKNFNKLFECLIILSLSHENEIRNCGNALDELLKNEIGYFFQENYSNNKIYINNDIIKNYVEYLIQKLNDEDDKYNKHPAIKLLIVTWFNFFEGIPQITLVEYYEKIIPALLKMLCFKTKDEYECSELCLKKILISVESHYEILIKEHNDIILNLIEIIINGCNENNEPVKICCFEWLEMFLTKFKLIINTLNNSNKKIKTYRSSKSFSTKEQKELNKKKNNENNSEQKNINNKENTLMRNHSDSNFTKNITILRNIPYELFPNILKAIIQNTLTNSEQKFFKQVTKCNNIILKILIDTPSSYIKNTIKTIISIFKNYNRKKLNQQSINVILDWTSRLLNRFKERIFNDEKDEKDYISKLIDIMADSDEITIKKIISILSDICLLQKNLINMVLKMIIEKFSICQDKIEIFGNIVIKILSKHTNIVLLIQIIVDILLNEHDDIFFLMKMVKILNKFILVENEAEPIRNKLHKFNKNSSDNTFFVQIFYLWSFNPFDTLILLLISNYFELSYYLSLELSKMKLKVEDYFELTQTVQIIESSLFNNVRIKLLNPKKNIFLVKTLYAILMLLPQGNAFNSLKCRLKSIEIISNLDEEEDTFKNSSDNSSKNEKLSNEKSSESIISNTKFQFNRIREEDSDKDVPSSDDSDNYIVNSEISDENNSKCQDKSEISQFIFIFQERQKEIENMTNFIRGKNY